MLRSSKLVKVVLESIKRKPSAIGFKNIIRNESNLPTLPTTRWNKDWKPGPYPRTKEERIAAAKKYYMIPEDYEPYPEEEGFGDYPMFKKVHMEFRNPHEPFDFDTLKRNYCEPVHPDFDECYEDRINFDEKMQTPLWKQWVYVVTGVTLYTMIMLYDRKHLLIIDTVPKQYPLDGIVHYTFEPAE